MNSILIKKTSKLKQAEALNTSLDQLLLFSCLLRKNGKNNTSPANLNRDLLITIRTYTHHAQQKKTYLTLTEANIESIGKD